MRVRRLAAGLALAGLLAALGGCGSDDNGGTITPGTSPPSNTTPSTTTPAGNGY